MTKEEMLPTQSLLESLHPTLEPLLQWVIQQKWLLIPLSLLCLIASRRHSILAYGSQKSTWWIHLFIAMLTMLAYKEGLVEGVVAQLQLLALIFLMDNIINSLQLHRTPFFTFNLGLLLGLLSLTHPAYLLFAPLLPFRLQSLNFSSPKHYSGMLMGTLTPWLLFLFLTTTPHWSSLSRSLREALSPLWSLTLPTRDSLPQLVLILLYALLATMLYHHSYLTSTIRTRYIVRFHQQIGWFFLLLHLLYGASPSLSSSGFLLIGLFFIFQPLTHFTTLPIPSNRFLPLLFAVLITLLLGVTFHTQFTQLIS